LADKPEHATILENLRGALRGWQLETRDLGFMTEPQVRAQMAGRLTPWDIGQARATYPLERLLDAAGAVGQADAAGRQRRWLTDGSDAVRYWAAVGLAAREGLDDSDRAQLHAALHDASPVVRIEAAAALAKHGDARIALPVLAAALHDKSSEVMLHAARALELLGTLANPVRPQMQTALDAARRGEAAGDEIAMFVRFSLEAALAN
jgi:HEAT repeat protein